MLKRNQMDLASAFLNAMKVHILENIARCPEHWDGFEIRKFCADEFAFEADKFKGLPHSRKVQYGRDRATLPVR